MQERGWEQASLTRAPHAGASKGCTSVFSRGLAESICEGIAAQKRIEDLGVVARDILGQEKMMEAAKVDMGECPSAELHELGYEGMVAYDDDSRQELDPKLMMAARKDEIQYFRQMGVYEKKHPGMLERD